MVRLGDTLDRAGAYAGIRCSWHAHIGAGCSLYALPPRYPPRKEAGRDEDRGEEGDVRQVPPRSRQGAQGGIRPPTPRWRLRARHGRVRERRGESTRDRYVVSRALARRDQPRGELSDSYATYARVHDTL